MKYVFHPEALTEYADAVQYYAEKRQEVAQAFIDAIERIQFIGLGLHRRDMRRSMRMCVVV